jgi:hypothetical protein
MSFRDIKQATRMTKSGVWYVFEISVGLQEAYLSASWSKAALLLKDSSR